MIARRLVAVVAAALVPSIAQASMFSLVANLFVNAPKQVAAAPVALNSQTIDLLKADLNPNLDAGASRGGAEIAIIDGIALASDNAPASSEDREKLRKPGGQISIYVVRPGDTLSEIAAMFDVSASTIMWANNLKSKTVREGQILTILPISGVRYIVAKGDTVKSIAKKFKGDADEIVAYNNLDSETLAVGTEIIIPDGEIAAPPPQKKTSGSSASSLNVAISDGYYMRPVKGGAKTQGIHGWNGIDIGVPVGTTAYASADGDVIVSKDSGWNGGYGQYIVISHPNGTQTLYAHLSGNIVVQGQRVVQGQVIGYTGNTGKSTGPHIHFEVRGARNPF